MKKLLYLLLPLMLCACAERNAARVAKANGEAATAETASTADVKALMACINAYALKNFKTSEPDDIATAVVTVCSEERKQYGYDTVAYFRAAARAYYHADHDTPKTLQWADEPIRKSLVDMDVTVRSQTLARVLALRAGDE